MAKPNKFTFEVTPKIIKRFFRRIDKNGPIVPYVGTPCWIWIPYKLSKNRSPKYRYFFAVHGQYWMVHRVSWVLHNGPIPEGMLVCHKCDNPDCVNPEHLFTGTHDDNMKDKHQKGRNWTGGIPPLKRGAANGNSKITQDTVNRLRALHATGQYSQMKLARIFIISQAQVWNIVNLRQWVN